MTMLLDEQEMQLGAGEAQTLGNAMTWVQARLRNTDKIVVKVEVAGQVLDGPALDANHALQLEGREVAFSTASRVKLTHSMLGKLAALVDFLGQQHPHIAGLLEKGETAKAMELLGGALSAWGQIHEGFRSLTQLLQISLDELMVGERPASELIAEFKTQLEEVGAAIQKRDLVLLADILQYEMDRAVENWKALLAAVLGVVGVEGIE